MSFFGGSRAEHSAGGWLGKDVVTAVQEGSTVCLYWARLKFKPVELCLGVKF